MSNLSDKLKEMRERCEAATPDYWRLEDYREDGDWRSTGLVWARTEEQYYSPGKCVLQIDHRKLSANSPPEEIAEFEANAAFVCAARTDMPALLDAIEVFLVSWDNLSNLTECKCRGHMCPDCYNDSEILKACWSAVKKTEAILLKAGK